MKYYQIQATITVHDDEGYAITRQVPTFHLDSIIHGLRNAEVASSFAKKMLMEISGGEEIHINSVIEVPVWA